MDIFDWRTLVGQTFGRYRIGDIIGQGGAGMVYRAHDLVDRRRVALKVLGEQSGRDAADRFKREALWLSRCVGPHIVTLYDAGRVAGFDYIAMELVSTTLHARVRAGHRGVQEAVWAGAGILRGLAAAHRVGIIHRDIKPANVGIAAGRTIKLLDFGIANPLPWSTLVQECETGAGLSPMAGTLDYMPPEQVCGDRMDERVDIYSTGAVLYQLATGRLPFRASRRLGLINDILNRQPIPPSAYAGVSPALDALVLRALAKSPSDRFASATAMLDALLQLEGAGSIGVDEPPALDLRLTEVAV